MMLNSDTNKCCDMGTTKYLDKHQNKHEIESIHKYNEYILPLPQVQPYAGATRLHATFTPPPTPQHHTPNKKKKKPNHKKSSN